MGGGSGGAGATAGQQGPGDFNYWEGLIVSSLIVLVAASRKAEKRV